MSRIDEIEARVQAATPGPWEVVTREDPYERGEEDHFVGMESHPKGGWEQDSTVLSLTNALFIAHAREDVPWLIARVRELEAVVATIDDVRWLTDHEGDNRCALCRSYQDSNDHDEDCPFILAQAALAGKPDV